MSVRAQIAFGLAAALLLAAPVQAQTAPERRDAGGLTRTFAEPLYWRNLGPADRVPIRERALTRRLGFAGVAPVPDRRYGLTPYATLSYTLQDAEQPAPVSNRFWAAGVGLDYRWATATQRVFADYYAEITGADGSGSGIDNHGGFLSYSRELSARDRVSLFATHSSTTDLLAAPAPGLIANADRFEASSLALSYGHDPTRRSGVELTLTGLWQSTDDPATVDADTVSLAGRAWYFPSAVGRVDADIKLARLEIGTTSETMQDLRLGYTADLGSRLAVSGYVGALHTSADQGRTFGWLGGTVKATGSNWRLQMGLEREIIAVPGLATPALSDLLSASWEFRLSDGLLNELKVEGQQLEQLGGARSQTEVLSVSNQLSYALRRKSWLWGRLSLVREKTNGVRTEDTQLSIGISRNLR